MKKTFLMYALITLLLSNSVVLYAKSSSSQLEKQLILSMKLNKATNDRIGDSGRAIRGYIKANYLKKKPMRFDYVDSWVLQKPANFMGYNLLVIEEEYQTKYIGCCVDPGVGAILKVKGSIKKLLSFARRNGCSVDQRGEVRRKLKSLGVRLQKSKKYVSLSCRERDISHHYFTSTDGNEYKVNTNRNGAVLISLKHNTKIYLGNSCDASSKYFGKGIWNQKYGNTVIQFGRKKIKFTNQQFTLEDEKSCS